MTNRGSSTASGLGQPITREEKERLRTQLQLRAATTSVATHHPTATYHPTASHHPATLALAPASLTLPTRPKSTSKAREPSSSACDSQPSPSSAGVSVTDLNQITEQMPVCDARIRSLFNFRRFWEVISGGLGALNNTADQFDYAFC
jgi:hypothetical protein